MLFSSWTALLLLLKEKKKEMQVRLFLKCSKKQYQWKQYKSLKIGS